MDIEEAKLDAELLARLTSDIIEDKLNQQRDIINQQIITDVTGSLGVWGITQR